MSLNLAGPVRTALIGAAPIVALLSTWESEPSVHTRRPAPSDAPYPMGMVELVGTTDRDAVNSTRPLVMTDIAFYGEQPDQFRDVEALAYLARDLFHRRPQALTVTGYDVVSITVAGPFPGPTDDESRVCRTITLTTHLRKVV